MRDLAATKEFFKDDVYATDTTGIVIEAVDDNYAKCSMKLEGRHKNAAGAIQGGAIFTLADFAFAVATNEPGKLTVTLVSQISYLGVAKSDTLYAETRLIKDGKRNCFFEVMVTDSLDNAVAVVSTSGAHLS